MNHSEEMLAGKTVDVSEERDAKHQLPSSSRRSFLGLLLGAGGATVGAVLSLALLGFVLHPIFKGTIPTSWKEVCDVEDLARVSTPVKKLVTIEQRDGW